MLLHRPPVVSPPEHSDDPGYSQLVLNVIESLSTPIFLQMMTDMVLMRMYGRPSPK
jgi:hypothetical protein